MRSRLPEKRGEISVCGWQAVQALFERHPDQIKRLFFDASTGKRAGKLCSYIAEHRKVYRQLPREELERVAGTLHHGGIVAVIAERPLHGVTREVIDRWAERIDARRALSPLVGCFFASSGPTDKWVHIWAYKDPGQRQQVRAEAVRAGIWPPLTGDLLLKQENLLARPAAFSPLH